MANTAFNVNNPAFGRWAHKKDHNFWHSGEPAGRGGQFHQVWEDFIEAERRDAAAGERYTRAEILDKMYEIRAQFPVTLTE